jgi:hypothetical protein
VKRAPYRLAARKTLTAEPAFTSALVLKLVDAALRGGALKRQPKLTKWATLSEAERAAMLDEWASILNHRRHEFFLSQQDRGRKDRRERAKALVAELQELLPELLGDSEGQRDRFRERDPFANRSWQATRRLADWAMFSAEFFESSVPHFALPPVDLPDNVRDWRWCGSTLLRDFEPLLGTNASCRFIADCIPLLSGETPSPASVERQLKTR